MALFRFCPQRRQGAPEGGCQDDRATADRPGSGPLTREKECPDRVEHRLEQYEQGRRDNPDYLRQIWEEERGKLLARLKANGQLGLLDRYLGPDGLDITIAPLGPGRRP